MQLPWAIALMLSVAVWWNPPPASAASCTSAADVAAMFPKTDIVEYDFTGNDGIALAAALDSIVGRSSTAVSLHVVYLTQQSTFFLFSVDADGCFVFKYLDLTWAEVDKIFQKAGVQPPFGATFFQLPSVRA